MHLVKKPKHGHKFCASSTNYLMNHECLKQRWKDLKVLAKAKLCSQSTNKRQIVVIPFQNVFFTKWYCNHQVDYNAIGPDTCFTYTSSLNHHHWNLWIGTQVEFLDIYVWLSFFMFRPRQPLSPNNIFAHLSYLFIKLTQDTTIIKHTQKKAALLPFTHLWLVVVAFVFTLTLITKHLHTIKWVNYFHTPFNLHGP